MKFQFAETAGRRGAETPKSEKILRAARRLLVREGFATFSARGVAKEAKVSLGALQYCYRTKHALMAATLEHVVNGYEAGYRLRLRNAPPGGESRFVAILDYLISDIWDQDSRRLFLGLWGMSSHNKLAADLLRQIYEFHVERLGGFIKDANPRLGDEQPEQLAVHVIAMLEGLMLFSQKPGKTLFSKAQMTRMTRRTVLQMVGLKIDDL